MVTIEKLKEAFTDAPLTANDRCDRCSAAAKVRVYMIKSNLELLFCGHHMRENEGKLKEIAYFNTNWAVELQ
jgi:Zn ribbon nucleic-acid-binding protein